MLDARNEVQMISVITNMCAAFERWWLYDLNNHEITIKSKNNIHFSDSKKTTMQVHLGKLVTENEKSGREGDVQM